MPRRLVNPVGWWACNTCNTAYSTFEAADECENQGKTTPALQLHSTFQQEAIVSDVSEDFTGSPSNTIVVTRISIYGVIYQERTHKILYAVIRTEVTGGTKKETDKAIYKEEDILKNFKQVN
jgi:hypothetical protein